MISRFALQAVTSLGIVLVALMLTDGQPLYAQGDEGCHFLMHLRAPVEFTGPAGGNDFELYRPTTHGADILLSNVYGDQPCNWHASTNQNWLDLSRNSGEIAGGDDTFITVSVNDRAQDLSRGIHKAEVVLQSSQGRQPNTPWKVDVIVYARTPCDLTVIGGAYTARMEEGNVPPDVGLAILSNAGDAPCHWQAQSSSSWLTVTPTNGTVTSGHPEQITIEANEGVANLDANDYDTVVQLIWTEIHRESLRIEAKLEVEPRPCNLQFPEGQEFTASGDAGEQNFAATNTTYALRNIGGTDCYNWQARHTAEWLSIPDESTIPKNGGSVDVRLRLNQQAAAELLPGTYDTLVRFGAGSRSSDHGIKASLVVKPQPCHLDIQAEEEGLYFRVQPAELGQGILEQVVALRNDPKNSECQWVADAPHDWIKVEPNGGVLAGGESAILTVKIALENNVDELRIGSHEENLGFRVTDGTTAESLSMEVDVKCAPQQPCAYLHSTHIKTEVGRQATINVTMYNPLRESITATLRAPVPSGWELKGKGFAERCGAICNGTYSIPGGQQEFIEIYAVPNNPGNYSFEATVNWTMANVGEGDEPEGIELSLPVDVTLPVSGSVSPQPLPPADTASLTFPSAPLVAATVVPRSGEPADSGQSGVKRPDDGPIVGGIPNWLILVLGILGAIGLVVMVVLITWMARRRRLAIDYDELARALERQRTSR